MCNFVNLQIVQQNSYKQNLVYYGTVLEIKIPKLFMFVFDSLMVETPTRIMQLLAASIESLFQVMGEDNLNIRRSNLSMEKYYSITCSYEQIQLGVLINTRTMTVQMTDTKKQQLIKELERTRLMALCT